MPDALGPGGAGAGPPGGPPEMPCLTGFRVRVEVRPTEDRERLRTALAGIFPDLNYEIGDDLEGTGADAGAFRRGVLQTRIADAVAAHMVERGRNGGGGASAGTPGEFGGPWTTRFLLNKQAMVMGKLHLGDEGAAMGDVEVRMEFASRPSREALLLWFLDTGR